MVTSPMFAQRRRTGVGALLLGVIAAAAVTVHAADAFARPLALTPSAAALQLKLPPGTTRNSSPISLSSYGFGANRAIGMAANAQALTISKFTDSTSPMFLQHYASGAPFKGSTELDVVVRARGGASTLITIVLGNAVVLQDTASGTGGTPSETISLNYEAVTYCWKPAPTACTHWTKSHMPEHARPR